LRSSLPPELAEGLARAAGRLGIFSGEPLWFPDISSTNDVALSRAEQGAHEGRVVVADAQSSGRGRHGRAWVSPAGAGLYFSVVLRPRRDVHLLTIAAGVAVTEGVERATGLSTQLKWPNDVYASGRKLAGILAEGGSGFVVLGVGVNVLPATYPPEVAGRATSLEGELGRPVDRGLVLAECLAALATSYEDVQEGRARAVLDAWRRRAAGSVGRPVRWAAGHEGVAEGIDDTGALIVRTPGGPVRLISGEVQWI